MPEPAEDIEPFLATVAEMMAAENMMVATDLLKTATFRSGETGYDNWNGGTSTYTVFLEVDPATYAQLGEGRAALEEQIGVRLKAVVESHTTNWYSVSIVPKVTQRPDWRETKGSVSQAVRRNIIDGLKLDDVAWAGGLEEVEFLERIFDLQRLPSTDSRFDNAAGDIWQHRVNNPEDWADDWIYSDDRFNLMAGSSDSFLRFLCEMANPVVRPDRNEALRLVQHFNDQLRQDGWMLVEQERIAGRPRYVAMALDVSGGRAVSRARTVADALDAGWMQKEIERLENSVERDPALAIGTAKDLVESCCKSILTKRGVGFTNSAGLPDLTKLLAKELKLVPEGISDEARGSDTVKHILRSLSSITHHLAELRGLYGSGHGREGHHRGLEPRHARLAVGAAVAFIDFVTETHHRRPADEK
ncbi:abortive infection family protein [Brevundimonas nasdae]|uniref:Abortive infection family protein n=1 Tax=Brevundimonas nasdae TaxID=172043 RepID=A0ABX8TDT1_9CAUL|nr:abortive infection family protein [Brevundimonas nasdae]QYC09341.1 abortive infection family protein [Brevundimonas nasdae]QYC15389.1 abortive infection family protein [Brevundimonas nasdae]